MQWTQPLRTDLNRKEARFTGGWKKEKIEKRVARSKVWAEKKRVYIVNERAKTENDSKSH